MCFQFTDHLFKTEIHKTYEWNQTTNPLHQKKPASLTGVSDFPLACVYVCVHTVCKKSCNRANRPPSDHNPDGTHSTPLCTAGQAEWRGEG